MKNLRTVVLATTMALAMTTGVFAASCPTSTANNANSTTCQLQQQKLSDYKSKLNCQNGSVAGACKNVAANDLATKDSTFRNNNASNKKNCIENIKSNCNLSEIKMQGMKKLTCQKPVAEKPVAEKPVVEKPVAEKPVAEKPVAEKPVVEKPVAEKPVVEKPVTENLTNSQFLVEVVRLVNVERAKAGLNELTSDAKIQAAAYVRSTEQQQQFSHTRPNGTSCFTALAEQGVSYSGSGENIAMGQKTPAEVMNAWMNSEGHRANILNKNFTNIGVGYYENNGTAYWTQMFTY